MNCRNWKNAFILITALSLVACGASGPAPVSTPRGYLDDIPSVYRVQYGDTLFSLAWKYGLNIDDIVATNKLPASKSIYVGQLLKLKAAERHSKPSQNQLKKQKRPADSVQNNLKPVSGNIKWQWPVIGKLLPTSRHYPNAIRISGREGQKIRAAADGKVVYKGSGLRGYGKLIIIKHNKYYLSAYAHNRKLLVNENDVVKAGQVIAEMGHNDQETAALHFEIRKNGKPVKPQPLLPH